MHNAFVKAWFVADEPKLSLPKEDVKLLLRLLYGELFDINVRKWLKKETPSPKIMFFRLTRITKSTNQTVLTVQAAELLNNYLSFLKKRLEPILALEQAEENGEADKKRAQIYT